MDAELTKASPCPIPSWSPKLTVYPYRVEVTPRTASKTVWSASQCIYSVSIGAANRQSDDLVDGLVWTKARFPRVTALVGDSLYAVTLRIQRGLDESASYSQAIASADEAVQALEQSGPVRILRTSEVTCNDDFARVESAIEDSYSSVPEFALSIDADARTFVSRQAKNNRLSAPLSLAESLARRYLLREVAIYAYLASHGWLVDVYVGRELPTLARIIEGTVPAVAHNLARRINISLSRRDTT